MQSVAPLVRSTQQAVQHTTRIPHLRYHILSRARQQRKLELLDRRPVRQQSRCVGALATADNFYESHNDEIDTSHDTKENVVSEARAESVANHVSWDFFSAAGARNVPSNREVIGSSSISAESNLREAHAERTLEWLTCHEEGREFTRSASSHDFAQAFCALNPQILVDPAKELGSRPRNYNESHIKWPKFPSVVEYLQKYEKLIDGILSLRQEAKQSLTLEVCRHALKLAAATGNSRVAEHIWNDVIPKNKLFPDISCYNHLLAAYVWNLAFGQQAAIGMRNTERSLRMRASKVHPRVFNSYSVSLTQANTSGTMRSLVLDLFTKLTQQGLKPTESTFCNIIMAMARAGDVTGFESILKSVWNVDMQMLQNYDEEEIQSPTFYDEGHVLRPSKELLVTVVHGYCTNSEVDKASQMLDFLSRNYALEIPLQVWSELFEWTYVMSRPRSINAENQGQKKGQIAPSKLKDLLQTITDEPYNIEATPEMQDLMIRNAKRWRSTAEVLK
ncbi:hypothetical protein LTR66_015844, partial [Elasticomyces elasticus]